MAKKGIEERLAKNAGYWRERFRQLEESRHGDIQGLLPGIDRAYKRAQAEMEKEIRSWYQRLADNNGVSMAEARKLLSEAELEEFKWTVEEYVKRGEENAIDQRWVKELENASARFHISRLEALKLQAQQSLEVVYGNQLDQLDVSMRELYQDGYYRTAFELQKGFGIGFPIAAIDQNKLDKVIKKPWAADGKNFSERTWGSKAKLVNEVHAELTRMCVTGAAPDTAIRNIAKKMDASRHNAGRLVMTEAAYFGSESQKECFNDLGVERYEICATLDSRTSDICRGMDGKIFGMEDFEAGVTAPPFHVFCRTCTAPYFNDEFTKDEMRAARGADGRTHYVPADMKYPEWKRRFVGKGDKFGLEVSNEGSITHWTKKEKADTINFMDITKEWVARNEASGRIIEKQEYIINGTAYKVDGKHVVLQPTDQERKIAAILSEQYGKTVELVPQVLYPQGIQTPDYLINGERFDLKSPIGQGKNLLYSMLSKKKKQAPNFILDITNCPLAEKEIVKQVEGIFASRHTRFAEKIVLLKENNIIGVFARK